MAQQTIVELRQTFEGYASDEELLAAARAWAIRRRFQKRQHRYLSVLVGVFYAIFFSFALTLIFSGLLIKVGWMDKSSVTLFLIEVSVFSGTILLCVMCYALMHLLHKAEIRVFLQSEEASAEKILPEFLRALLNESRERLLGESSDFVTLKRNLSKRATEADKREREIGGLLKQPQPADLRAEFEAERDELMQFAVRTQVDLQRLNRHITNLTTHFEERSGEMLSRVLGQFVLKSSRQFRQQAETERESVDDAIVKSLRVFAGELGRIQKLSALCEPQKMFLNRDALADDLDTFERVADSAFALESPTAQARAC